MHPVFFSRAKTNADHLFSSSSRLSLRVSSRAYAMQSSSVSAADNFCCTYNATPGHRHRQVHSSMNLRLNVNVLNLSKRKVYLGLPCLTLFDAFHQLFVLLPEIKASQQTSQQFLHPGFVWSTPEAVNNFGETTHLNRHSKPSFYDASLFFLLPGFSQTMLQR
jgi:hypothetical protein